MDDLSAIARLAERLIRRQRELTAVAPSGESLDLAEREAASLWRAMMHARAAHLSAVESRFQEAERGRHDVANGLALISRPPDPVAVRRCLRGFQSAAKRDGELLRLCRQWSASSSLSLCYCRPLMTAVRSALRHYGAAIPAFQEEREEPVVEKSVVSELDRAVSRAARRWTRDSVMVERRLRPIDRVLAVVNARPGLPASKIARIVGLQDALVARLLDELVISNRVERRGHGRARGYSPTK